MSCCSRAQVHSARRDHALQRARFELLVLLADLDQLGQFVVALLEQHVDVRPGLGNSVLDLNQIVIDDNCVDNDHSDEAEEQNGTQTHFSLP